MLKASKYVPFSLAYEPKTFDACSFSEYIKRWWGYLRLMKFAIVRFVSNWSQITCLYNIQCLEFIVSVRNFVRKSWLKYISQHDFTWINRGFGEKRYGAKKSVLCIDQLEWTFVHLLPSTPPRLLHFSLKISIRTHATVKYLRKVASVTRKATTDRYESSYTHNHAAICMSIWFIWCPFSVYRQLNVA